MTWTDPPVPPYVAHWVLGRKLGSGYSGYTYQATHVYTGEVVALKLQPVNHECPTNRYERHIYPLIQGGVGMPTLWASGVYRDWDYLAIDLLGASLDGLYKNLGGPTVALDLGCVCSIAMQTIARLELMHTRGVLHRDIQPGNTVVGSPPNDKLLYMIDFGFSKQYIDPYTRRHIPNSKVKRDFIGNYFFSSVNVHCRGKVPSRRDDLEAAALMFIHLLTPRGLIWTRGGVPKTEAAHDELKLQKRRATAESLCQNLPAEFEEFLRYCRSLKFAETPDYGRWIEEFKELKIQEGYGGSDEFVWPPPLPNRTKKRVAKQGLQRPPTKVPGLIAPGAVEGILNDLTNLNLNQPTKREQVLGDRRKVEEAAHKVRAELIDDSTITKQPTELIGNSQAGTDVPPFMATKAHQLLQLTRKVPDATDNKMLSGIVLEFVQVMKYGNRSRTLTREGFGVLDALYKQLADPDVFVAPLRLSQKTDAGKAEEKQPRHVRLRAVARLKNEVGRAQNNKLLAEMVADFGKVTNRSTGRNITKDGFGFLDGLVERLLALH